MADFHVYIVESPNSPDLYHKRFEGETLTKTLSLSQISSSHRLAVKKEAFVAALTVGLKEHFEDISTKNLSPLIHISSHGNEEGLELTSGEKITWDELKDLLKPLNKFLKGGLLVCMSSCNGSSGCKMAMKDDDFPFLVIVGSNAKPTWAETNIGFATLYHLLSKGCNLKDAVSAMRVASDHKNFTLIYSSDARKAYIEVTSHTPTSLATLQSSFPTDNLPKLQKAIGN